MMPAETMQSSRGSRGKRKPSMLILGSFEKLKQDLIPALFRIAGDHGIGHIDIIRKWLTPQICRGKDQ